MAAIEFLVVNPSLSFSSNFFTYATLYSLRSTVIVQKSSNYYSRLAPKISISVCVASSVARCTREAPPRPGIEVAVVGAESTII
jgi:hypothetical protein